MKPTDIAYIAGLFDGEGDFGVNNYKATKNGATYARVKLRISNTDRGVLEWVRDTVGAGSIAAESNKTNPKWKPIWRTCFRYSLYNRNAVALLKAMRPFLKIKAAKADTLLAGKISGRVHD